MANVIQINRTTSAASVPAAALDPGELAVCIAPGVTKMWLGDGTLNRLLLSTDVADTPVMTQGFLELTGGSMTGPIILLPPVAAGEATNKQYVDNAVASLRNFLGTWQVAANTPDISVTTGNTAGDFYIAVTTNPNVPENAPAGTPGIGGQSINNGDFIFWNAGSSIYEIVVGGALTVADANGLYVQLSGSTLTGALILNGPPTAPNQAATMAWVEGLVTSYLPLSGGILTGALTLSGDPTANMHAATKKYVDDTVGTGFTGVTVDGSSILGDGLVTPLSVGDIDGGTF